MSMYAAVSRVPKAAIAMKVRKAGRLRPSAGSNAPNRASISPQNPARPGSPSEATAAKARRPPRRGALPYSAAPDSRARVSRSVVPVRSLSAPTRKNSRPVMRPWAMLANSAPFTPVGVMVAMPRSTKPMWPTEE